MATCLYCENQKHQVSQTEIDWWNNQPIRGNEVIPLACWNWTTKGSNHRWGQSIVLNKKLERGCISREEFDQQHREIYQGIMSLDDYVAHGGTFAKNPCMCIDCQRYRSPLGMKTVIEKEVK